MTVDSAVGLVAPVYLVVDPDVPAKREFVKADAVDTGSGLLTVTANRGLAGSAAGGQAHDAGAKVRAVAMQQWLEDIFDDVEDLEQADADHVAAPDPHTQYLTAIEGDAAYVEVAGDTMTGPLVLNADPSAALGAATKQYVDGGITTHAADVDAHHTKYTDAEAASAARDGESDSFGKRPLADAKASGSQSIPNGIATKVTVWADVVANPDGLLTADTTFTVPAGEAGMYSVSTAIVFDSDVVGERTAKLLLNGSAAYTNDSTATTGKDYLVVAAVVFLGVGDTIEVEVFQSSGGALGLDVAACRFGVCKVSD